VPGVARVYGERPVRGVQGCIQLQTMLLDDRLVVQAQRIDANERGGAYGARERLVQPLQRAIHFADVAPKEREIDAIAQRTLHQIERGLRIALTECHDAGEVQGIPVGWRDREDAVEQSPCLGQPTGLLVFAGDPQRVGQRHRRAVRCNRPGFRHGRLHQSSVCPRRFGARRFARWPGPAGLPPQPPESGLSHAAAE
jgi:hypothetical protein